MIKVIDTQDNPEVRVANDIGDHRNQKTKADRLGFWLGFFAGAFGMIGSWIVIYRRRRNKKRPK